MEIEISKVGERGQIVIPQEMRKDLGIQSGKKVLILEGENEVIVRPFNKFKMETLEELKEQIIDMKLAEEAMEDIKKGNYESMSEKKFFKKMDKWINK